VGTTEEHPFYVDGKGWVEAADPRKIGYTINKMIRQVAEYSEPLIGGIEIGDAQLMRRIELAVPSETTNAQWSIINQKITSAANQASVGWAVCPPLEPVAETLGTTEEHPFYVDGKGWVEAADLTASDLVVSHAPLRPAPHVQPTRAGAI
jgi:hypothetical protein